MKSGSDVEIVLGPDGVILAATGDVPKSVLDMPLEECAILPHEVRAAGATLVGELRRSGLRAVSGVVDLVDGSGAVHLIAIEAVVIRRAETDVRALLTTKLALMASQADSAGVHVSIKVGDEVPAAVRIDAEKVAWAVTTLVGNALRYIRSATRQSGMAINVLVSFDARQSVVIIEVQDNGPGVPADTAARLFKRDGLNVRGAGLGLLVIADICKAHGGTADVRSSVSAADHGVAVRLVLAAP